MADFLLGPYQPDRGPTSAVVQALNVIPKVDGYGPHPSLYTDPSAEALPDEPKGMLSVVLNDGSYAVYALTTDTLYQLGADFTWTLIATGFNCPTGYDWSMLQFGNKLLFTNINDGLQEYDIEAGGSVTYIAAAGDPAYVFTCANFIIGLNCLDSTGARDLRLIKTSGFNDQTNWTTNGADYQDLADGGELVAGFDLKQNTALLVQTGALVLMTFADVGGGAQFGLSKISGGKGGVSARCCVSFDGMVFGLDTDDFWRFDLTNSYQPIGADQVAKTFLIDVDQSNLALVQACIDPFNKVIRYRYKRAIDSSTVVSEIMIGYEWRLKRWFTCEEAASFLAPVATAGVTYDAASGTYDDQTLTYDSRLLAGGLPIAGGLDGDFKFAAFTGASLEAVITTQVGHSPVSGKIQWATVVSDAVAPSLELGVSDSLAANITFGDGSTPDESGRVNVEGRGKNIQFRLTIPAGDAGIAGTGWTTANGITDIVGSKQGPK